jgi:hypothetical protein
MVEKNNRTVQCKRIGKYYIGFKNEYLCDKHHDAKEVETQRILKHKTCRKSSIEKAVEKAYSINSTNSSNCESYEEIYHFK